MAGAMWKSKEIETEYGYLSAVSIASMLFVCQVLAHANAVKQDSGFTSEGTALNPTEAAFGML